MVGILLLTTWTVRCIIGHGCIKGNGPPYMYRTKGMPKVNHMKFKTNSRCKQFKVDKARSIKQSGIPWPWGGKKEKFSQNPLKEPKTPGIPPPPPLCLGKWNLLVWIYVRHHRKKNIGSSFISGCRITAPPCRKVTLDVQEFRRLR